MCLCALRKTHCNRAATGNSILSVCSLRRTEHPYLRASLTSCFQKSQTLVQTLKRAKNVCFIVFRDLQIVRFQETLKASTRLLESRLFFSMKRKLFKTLEKLPPLCFPASSVVDVSCSFLSLSLFPNIFALFSPVRACTRSHPAEQ